MKKVFGLIGIIVGTQFIVSAPAIAQAPDTLWTKTYGGTDTDWGESVQECTSGGFIIAGWTYSFGAGSQDVYLIRTNSDGDTMWTKTYGGTDTDGGLSVQECANSGFIIAGKTESFGAGSNDVYLIRTNADGDTLWTKTYGGTSGDYGESVQECASGGFIIAGYTWSFGAGKSDVYLIRTNSDGDTMWTKTYGGTDTDWGLSVQECAGSGFIIAGGTESFGAGYSDVYLVRTNADGDTLWIKTYGGTNSDYGESVQECAGGGFIIAGMTGSFGANPDTTDVYLIRTDADGDTLWTKTYGGTDNDWGYSVRECAGGGFIIAGMTGSFGAGYSDVYLIRVGPEGTEIEERDSSPLAQNDRLRVFPNPSFGNALIKYGLPEKASITLRLYDISGRLVKTIYSGAQEKGYYAINVGARSIVPLPAGVYFIRFETDKFKATRKLTIIR